MKIVIASMQRVSPDNWGTFCKQVQECFPSVEGISIQFGNASYNFGFAINGDEPEQVANALTMALMPAKWALVPDSDPGVTPGKFEYNLRA